MQAEVKHCDIAARKEEQFVIDGFEIDETAPTEEDLQDLEDAAVSEETSSMLAQADELIAHETPEPVVIPEPVEITLPEPEIPEEETEDAPEEVCETEETSAADPDEAEESTETVQDEPIEAQPEIPAIECQLPIPLPKPP